MTAALLALLCAHESAVSSSRLEVAGSEIRATFTFALEDVAGLARLDLDRDGVVDPGEWRRALPDLVRYVASRFRIVLGEVPCAAEGDAGAVPPAMSLADGRTPVTIVLRYRLPESPDRWGIRCTLFHEHGGTPRHVAEVVEGRTIVFDRDRVEVDDLGPVSSGSRVPAAAVVGASAVLALAAAAARISSGVRSGAGS